jgi:hypothetical protein
MPKNPNRTNGPRWKPGQSGNPKGRPPKGYSISDMMKEMLGNNPTVKQKLGEKIMSLALAGDVAAIKTLWAYMDGTPIQHSDIKSGGKPLPIFDYVSKTRTDDSDQEDSEFNQET